MTITVTDLGGQEFGEIDPQAQDDQNNSNHENLCSAYAYYAAAVKRKTGFSPSSSTMYVLLGGERSGQPEEALDSFTLSTIGKRLPEGKQLRIMVAVDGAHSAKTLWDSILSDAKRKWEFFLSNLNHVKRDDFYKKPAGIEQLLNGLPVDTGKIPIRNAMLMLDLQMQLVKRLGSDELDDDEAALDFHAMFNQWFSAPIRKILQYLKSNQPDNDFFVCWSRDYLSAIIDALKLRTVDHYQDYNSQLADQDYYSLFEFLRYLAIPRTFEHNSWLLVTFYLELTRRGNINIEIFTEKNSFSNWLRLMVGHVVRRVDKNKGVDYLTWMVAAIWEKIAHIPENQMQDPKSKNTLIEIVNMFKSHLSEILGLKCGSIIVIKGLIEFPVEVAGDQSRPHALLYQYPFDDIPFAITEGIYKYYAEACKESAQSLAQGNECDIPNALTTKDLVSCIFFSRTFSRYQEFSKKILTYIFRDLPLANKKNILENVQPYLDKGVDIYTCFLQKELRQAPPPTDDSLSDKLQKSNDTEKAADKSTQCNASTIFSDHCNHHDPSRDADASEINNQPPKHELKKQRTN